jgi:hypothetical protein
VVVWEETVQVLRADVALEPLTTANTAGELSAVETIEADCVLSSCQRKAMSAKLWNQG